MNNVNHRVRSFLAGILIALSASLIAGPVTIPNTFSPNTPARAAEVNANFTAVKTAIDDNESRLTTAENRVATVEVTVTGGNIVLEPSTTSTGNVLKGNVPFFHNFGADNTFIGIRAGNFTTSGTGRNTVIGAFALANNTNGTGNTATGVNALNSNLGGGGNTANGVLALLNNTNGDFNTAIGTESLASNSIGRSNTAIGNGALFRNNDGSSNIALGAFAGSNLITGDHNIAIGNGGVDGESNTIRIGTVGTHSAVHIAGITGVAFSGSPVIVNSSGRLGFQVSSRAFKDTIVDMGSASRVLMKLRPVTFHYKSDAGLNERSLQFGLIAEEVAKVAPGLVARDQKGAAQAVYYHFLPPMLLNEYQKQQHIIDAQAARIDALESQAERTVALLSRLERATPKENRQ